MRPGQGAAGSRHLEYVVEVRAAVVGDADGACPLLLACQEGHVDVVRLLLDAGADREKARDDGATPLWIAC